MIVSLVALSLDLLAWPDNAGVSDRPRRGLLSRLGRGSIDQLQRRGAALLLRHHGIVLLLLRGPGLRQGRPGDLFFGNFLFGDFFFGDVLIDRALGCLRFGRRRRWWRRRIGAQVLAIAQIAEVRL